MLTLRRTIEDCRQPLLSPLRFCCGEPTSQRFHPADESDYSKVFTEMESCCARRYFGLTDRFL
ncbi:hypothetical protein AYO47_07555 [Planctomyces sp. SCGC AG-212-M04]|nr:hypothetical protein AYO47_07555 [Planctomyces sp. SCGC AG-212-M04]